MSFPFAAARAEAEAFEQKARECRQALKPLQALIDNLQMRTDGHFQSWKGTGAESVHDAVRQRLRNAQTACDCLRRAAAALERGADEVRSAIRRAEAEEQAQRLAASKGGV